MNMGDSIRRFMRLTRCGMTEVLDGLYVGSLADAKDVIQLNENKVRLQLKGVILFSDISYS